MEVYQFILAVSGLVVITAFVVYKVREKSPRFRIVETRIGTITTYSPQAKIDGAWFHLWDSGDYTFYVINPYEKEEFLSEQDALSKIANFKTAGNYTIPSNEKLKYNQKAIIVE